MSQKSPDKESPEEFEHKNCISEWEAPGLDESFEDWKDRKSAESSSSPYRRYSAE